MHLTTSGSEVTRHVHHAWKLLFQVSFLRLIVCECQAIAMLLVLMLKQLAQLAKIFATWLATVGEIRSTVMSISLVLQHRSDELLHVSLGRSKSIDLIPRVIFTKASSAVATLNMLNSIGTGTESAFSAHRTRNCLGAVHLHVHVDFILVAEGASTRGTLVEGGVDTVPATRQPLSLVPLIITILITAFQTSALSTWAPNARATTRISVTTGPLVVAELISITVGVTVATIPSHGSL
jgi:hypothetical protein